MKKSERVLFLEGKRLYLRPLAQDDLGRCNRWINDPETRRWVTARFPAGEEAQREWLKLRTNEGELPKNITLAIVRKQGDRHIGNVGLHRISWVHRSATTGMLIGEPSERGKGYGPEAKALLLDYAFDDLGMHRIGAGAMADNRRSLRSLRKSGYREEGLARDVFFRDGKWVDEVMFSILDHEWRALRAKRNGK